jgi:predicted lipoprotein with Yx(FWY)xxD motif
VVASGSARSTSRAWSIVEIDPKSGRFANPGQTGALRVWTYRDRPVYTYAGDTRPGDINADGLGEFRAQREGFKAYWIRDDFIGRTRSSE